LWFIQYSWISIYIQTFNRHDLHSNRYELISIKINILIDLFLAASLLVCIEVLSTIFRHISQYLPDIYPKGTKQSYGICYILAWIIFFILLLSSFIFFVCSKKRKGTFDEATEEEALANLPVDLGRFWTFDIVFRKYIRVYVALCLFFSKRNLFVM